MRFQTQLNDQVVIACSSSFAYWYLQWHSVWFPNCAKPMQTKLIRHNAYQLTVGRFGAFGYQVEPRINLQMTPFLDSFRISTLPLQDDGQLYEVDFQAEMAIVPIDSHRCQINWELNLVVEIPFPDFINAMPQKLIQKTGDRLLARVVREISKSVNEKIAVDFAAAYLTEFMDIKAVAVFADP